jgi:hypothetical protein
MSAGGKVLVEARGLAKSFASRGRILGLGPHRA